MRMADILQPGFAQADLEAGSKKRLMQSAADFLAERVEDLRATDVYDALIARERLGSTAVGSGAAIPHCRIAGLEKAQVALFRLREAIAFDAPDNRPVQLVFVLLVPAEATSDHLEILRVLAESLSVPDYRIALLEAADDEALFQAAITPVAGAPAD